MSYPESAIGFMVDSSKNWSTVTKRQFKLKPFEDRDIDIAIDACGVCGSDVHTVSEGWGDAPLPLTVGHEVVGRAVRVGSAVKNIKVGDRVGVGAQIGADLTCQNCKADQENYCPNQVATYGSKYPDGTLSHGGYASYMRAHEYFTFPIPDSIPSEQAAPLMCAGLTVYSPLVRLGCGPGKKVAIIGIGGLGHLAVMFAAALGAEVYALSSSPNKKDDCMKLGAKEFIDTNKDGWDKNYAFTFDFILNCADATHLFNLSQYMGTMKVMGKLHCVGLPDEKLPQISTEIFLTGGYYMGGSHIGNRPEMLDMLKLVVDKNLKPIVQTLDISEASCKEALEAVNSNTVRYRYTLVGFDKVFGKR